MVVPGRRDAQQQLAVLAQDRLHQGPQRRRRRSARRAMASSSANICCGSNRDCGRHMRRVEAVGRVGLDHLADLADVQLRAVVRLAVDGAELVEHARRPLLAALGGPGRVVPDGKADLAAASRKATRKYGLPSARGQLLLGGHQQEQIGLLAGRHFGQGDDGHGEWMAGLRSGIGDWNERIATLD